MTNENNNNELVEEPEEMLECYFGGDSYPASEMRRVPLTQHVQHRRARHELWRLSNQDADPTTSPWYEDETNDDKFAWVHEDCSWRHCENCGELCDYDDNFNSELDMCDPCAEPYAWCHDHDRYWNTEYESQCEYCADEENDEDEYGSRLIHDYSYRPSPTFFVRRGADSGAVVFREQPNMSFTGFELEMEATNCSVGDGAQLAVDLFGEQTYLKYDGSLSSGFEMVSHPMSLEYINTKFDFNAVKQLADLGMRSAKTNTCGLHVHINKGFFNNRATSMYRFMSMFYANSEVWRRLAGRSNSSYAQWDIGEGNRLLHYTKAFGNGGNGYRDYNYDRYVAVNLQPSNTIELRFFKGTLRPETLQARLQAVHAVAEYSVITRNNINIKQASKWDTFRTWTESNADRFGAFNNYANDKGV